MIELLAHYFVLFMIYSFIGWLFEEITCSIGYRQLVNQGFLKGPYLPIYGCGAMLNLLVLGKIDNPVCIFICSIILTTSIEYIASFLLEKAFHARWWDYSNYHYQLHGRVWLWSTLAFGGLSILELKIVNPILEYYTYYFPEETVQYSAALMFVIFFLDLLFSAYRQYGKKEYYRFPSTTQRRQNKMAA